MEENEKKYEEETTSLPQTSEDTQNEVLAEVSAEPLTTDAPAYQWDFSASPEVQAEKKKRRSALI